jgi:hypothetical protein
MSDSHLHSPLRFQLTFPQNTEGAPGKPERALRKNAEGGGLLSPGPSASPATFNFDPGSLVRTQDAGVASASSPPRPEAVVNRHRANCLRVRHY